MGKVRRRKPNTSASSPYTKARSAAKKPQRTSQHGPKKKTKTSPAQAQATQSLPFQSTDKILLVGEGDFSYAASLATSHACVNLTATTLETKDVLLAKYPQASAHLSTLSSHSQTVLFSIDATKLGQPHAPGASILRKSPGFDVVIFNFPHVGGKSTDVNRQVRANQGLVVKFLEGAKRVLAPGGAVLLTIFEGQPYELWGVRNLARHVELSVERSMRFEKERFLGYSHARTLGNVENGWKGEEREARMYVLRKAGESKDTEGQNKRKVQDSEDDYSD
jgi:25S rRNA (uracil2634-N3)-methyltransferase